jgi:Ras-related protein Rab-8A
MEGPRLVKVVVVGDAGAGKTALVRRFMDNRFEPSYTASIGVDFKAQELYVDQQPVRLQVWDTAGQERFRAIVTTFYRGTQAVLLAFDAGAEDALAGVQRWAAEVRQHVNEAAVWIVVACKCDLPRVVEPEVGRALAGSLDCMYAETSAATGAGVQDVFAQAAVAVLARIGEPIELGPRLSPRLPEESDSCCG